MGNVRVREASEARYRFVVLEGSGGKRGKWQEITSQFWSPDCAMYLHSLKALSTAPHCVGRRQQHLEGAQQSDVPENADRLRGSRRKEGGHGRRVRAAAQKFTHQSDYPSGSLRSCSHGGPA